VTGPPSPIPNPQQDVQDTGRTPPAGLYRDAFVIAAIAAAKRSAKISVAPMAVPPPRGNISLTGTKLLGQSDQLERLSAWLDALQLECASSSLTLKIAPRS
jgi:hypothetical protein